MHGHAVSYTDWTRQLGAQNAFFLTIIDVTTLTVTSVQVQEL